MILLDTDNPFEDLLEDPFCFPQVFLQPLDGPMTLSETIELDKGKILIYQKEGNNTKAATGEQYAFVVCWDKRLDWDTFSGIYTLYEERVSRYADGHREQIEPVFIAKSIDNDVLRFIQQQADHTPHLAGHQKATHRTFMY